MKYEPKYLIVIAGPTAVGKSDLAVDIARGLAAPILSADSRQIYREMNIGTAKPSAADLKKVTHHFINERSVLDPFSAAQFEEEALQRLNTIFKQRKVAIVCGGTGLYINALCLGLDKVPNVDVEIRQHFDELYHKEGIESLQKQIIRKDPLYAATVDLHNHRRLIRALSVIEVTGLPFSSFLQTKRQPRSFQTINILLYEDRKTLYQRIDDRVDLMISRGLEQEVRDLLPYKELPALQTVGYQEWFPYLDGLVEKEEVIRLIKRNSRRYAKRQMTWFRKQADWQVFSNRDSPGIKKYISTIIEDY